MNDFKIQLGGRTFHLLDARQLARIVELVGPIEPWAIDEAAVGDYAAEVMAMASADPRVSAWSGRRARVCALQLIAASRERLEADRAGDWLLADDGQHDDALDPIDCLLDDG